MKYTVLHIPTGSFISSIDNIYTCDNKYAVSFSTYEEAKHKVSLLLSWSNILWLNNSEIIEVSGINEFEVVEMV